MSFDYDKIKAEAEGNHWATYSDLFTVLSLLFLMMYVVASLRSSQSIIQSRSDFMEIAQERDDLKQQIKVYNTLRDDYLETGASDNEQAMYEELMDKLKLLKEEAKAEAEDLRKAANENEKKEMALNKYQQMIRNIVNTNMVSAARIKRRDKTIEKNYEEIDTQAEEIETLEATVEQKQKQVAQGERQITVLNKEVEKKVQALQASFKANKISRNKMYQQIDRIKKKNQEKVDQLKVANAQAEELIQKNQEIIKEATQKLDSAERVIATQESDIKKLTAEKQEVTQKIADMRGDFKDQMKRERAEFDRKMANEKMSGQAKAAKQAEFLAAAKAKEDSLANQIQDMESQVQSMQGALEKGQKEKESLAAQNKGLAEKANNLANDKQKLSGDLARMKELAQAKEKLINNMKDNLAKAGLKASVDGKTGDVIIQFGEEYFDTGKATLKPGMETVLKKLMPTYSSSLFSDPNVAKKIKSVEIVGYASPTYKGKYVNPVSLEADNKEAVNYNLDLSYYRARSIFDYIFDTQKMKYNNQMKLLPMVKVTGRSFLAEGEDARAVSSMTHKEYCQKYDCKKSQRVVIKFNMEN